MEVVTSSLAPLPDLDKLQIEDDEESSFPCLPAAQIELCLRESVLMEIMRVMFNYTQCMFFGVEGDKKLVLRFDVFGSIIPFAAEVHLNHDIGELDPKIQNFGMPLEVEIEEKLNGFNDDKFIISFKPDMKIWIERQGKSPYITENLQYYEFLSIPSIADNDFRAIVSMPTSELSRICNTLQVNNLFAVVTVTDTNTVELYGGMLHHAKPQPEVIHRPSDFIVSQFKGYTSSVFELKFSRIFAMIPFPQTQHVTIGILPGYGIVFEYAISAEKQVTCLRFSYKSSVKTVPS